MLTINQSVTGQVGHVSKMKWYHSGYSSNINRSPPIWGKCQWVRRKEHIYGIMHSFQVKGTKFNVRATCPTNSRVRAAHFQFTEHPIHETVTALGHVGHPVHQTDAHGHAGVTALRWELRSAVKWKCLLFSLADMIFTSLMSFCSKGRWGVCINLWQKRNNQSVRFKKATGVATQR